MTASIINLDDYRQEKEPETPMEAGLKALKDNAKDTLKGVSPVDEYFKKHPFNINTMKNN